MVVFIYLLNKEKVIFFPPPKESKAITIDLRQFNPAPKIVPIKEKTPLIIPKKVEKKIVKIVQPKRKVIESKKVLVIKKSNEENNETKKEKNLRDKIKKLKEKKKRKKELKKKKSLEERKKRIEILKKMEKKMYKEQKRRFKEFEKTKTKNYNSPLANSLMNSGRAKSYQSRTRRSLNKSSSSRLIKQLYGNEFNSYSSQEKKFLKANLGRIHSITQRALSRNGYPQSAIRMGQEGVNIVSFYLHPNGNITKLKLEKSMGHSSLDRNTLQVIRIAYSEYPLPKRRTKIKFYVNYTIN